MIKAILFDHDDTLVATREVKWAHHKHVARTHYHKELTDDDILPHWGKPLPELVCLLYGTDNVDEALANNAASHEKFPKVIYPDTIPTLKKMKSLGKLTGIITATTRFSFDHDLSLHSIPKELLDYTQTAEDTKFHKPDPRVFTPAHSWLTEQHISPEEVLYVGDGLQDMKAALGANFHFVGVETGLTSAQAFSQHGVASIPGIAALTKSYLQRYDSANYQPPLVKHT